MDSPDLGGRPDQAASENAPAPVATPSLPAPTAPYKERLAARQNEATLLEICDHVANGGSLLDLCERWDLGYGHLLNWIRHDKARSDLYVAAMNDRGEWETEKVLREIRRIGYVKIKDFYNDDGTLKSPKDWPDDAAAALLQVEVDEIYEGSGENRRLVGYTRKVKLHPKLDAALALGKERGLFRAKVDLRLEKTLEDLLADANKKAPEPPAAAPEGQL